MKCLQSRRLFGAYWDDDTTQAEREWLEAHLASCGGCRREYDEMAKVLEWTADLPRTEASPDLVERTLARARRAVPAADRLPTVSVPWVPATAAAALLLVLGTMIAPWIGPVSRMAGREPDRTAVRQPVLVQPVATSAPSGLPSPSGDANSVAAIPDSLFDHTDDVEFILDPVTLRRDRATVTRTPGGTQAEQAIITF
jgi:anti-sigma factor RsiW